MTHSESELKALLDFYASRYNQPAFIADDPIAIPHLFSRRQDIEISGFLAAVLAWGNRKTIIDNALALMRRMDMAPYDFVVHHTEADIRRLLPFKHRTFNEIDLAYFLRWLSAHYKHTPTLETAFTGFFNPAILPNTETALHHFREYFFSLPHPGRTKKHIASPAGKSACKRLNMFLRWMVRKDNRGVDFGLWSGLRMSDLICPLDVHSNRIAIHLGLITDRLPDWRQATCLTNMLKRLDPEDPVRYDFALFGIGVSGSVVF